MLKCRHRVNPNSALYYFTVSLNLSCCYVLSNILNQIVTSSLLEQNGQLDKLLVIMNKKYLTLSFSLDVFSRPITEFYRVCTLCHFC